MTTHFLIILAVFWLLAASTLLVPQKRRTAFTRTKAEWAVDLIGLTMHGTIVPLFQTLVVYGVLAYVAPKWHGVVTMPWLAAFALNFVVIDYLYYWNHRWLHSARIWRFHSLHHSGRGFDVAATSRNSAVTTFLILYIWVNGIALFLLADPTPFALAMLASNCLDLLRHSGIGRWWDRFPGNLLISPRDHAWHHSRDLHGVNYGANLSIWDRIHGTYQASDALPEHLGEPVEQVWSAFWKGLP